MKPKLFAVGIFGVALLVFGVNAMKSKLDDDREVAVIRNLLAEYKAMGVPTNSSEYFKKIPDSENAWVEIGPVLLDEGGKGLNPLFRGGLAFDLAITSEERDLPTMKRYLAINQSKRDIIVDALARKPKFQIERDYDLGANLLYPEIAVLRTVVREFCLEALAAAYEGNDQKVIRDLGVSIRIANYFVERGELITTSISASVRTQIMTIAMRIMEKRPNLSLLLRTFLRADGRFTKPQSKLIFETEFLANMANARYFDLPIWDKSTAPFPLSLIAKPPKEIGMVEVMDLGKVQHGDYVPKSRKMRIFMTDKLKAWKAVFTKMNQQSPLKFEPTALDITTEMTTNKQVPEAMRELFLAGGIDGIIDQLTTQKQFEEAYHVIWKAMDVKSWRGQYPKSLGEIGLSVNSFKSMGGITYIASEKGVKLVSVQLNSNGDPKFRVSFPVSLAQTEKGMESTRLRAAKYRFGTTDYNGRELNSPNSAPNKVVPRKFGLPVR